MSATVKIHRSDRSAAVSTNASNEQEFLQAFVALGEAIDTVVLGQVVDICCKLRGYKANVIEHRVIVAGEWMPDDVVEVFSRERVKERVLASA